MVVVTGDMIDGWPDARFSDIEPLGQLRARDGVFAVTGNHEYYSTLKTGFRPLKNWVCIFLIMQDTALAVTVTRCIWRA
jgi:predicted MPP superfamily phosphohydrolase